MFTFLFLLLDRCTTEFSDSKTQRACQLWKHNWIWNRVPLKQKYYQQLQEYNEKLSNQTGNHFSYDEGLNMIDSFLEIEFDAYFDLLNNQFGNNFTSIMRDTSATYGLCFLNSIALIVITITLFCWKCNHQKLD